MNDQDALLKIKVAENKMRVLASYTPKMGNGKRLTVGDVQDTLELQGIKVGIKEDIIARMVESDRPIPSVVIVDGNPPGIGKNARIDTYIKLDKRAKTFEREDGSVDFKDLGEVFSALKNQKLYRKIPPTLGPPGQDVFGNEIPGLPGKDIKLYAGPGTTIDKGDPDLVIAARDGEVLIIDGIMQISEVHKVRGDVDYETGNIKFKGSVIIHGTVKSGFKVEADGDIQIHGNVEDAEVIGKNDIVVMSGCTGSGNGKIQAGGDIIVKFVENQTLIAVHDIIIHGDSYHAKLYSGGSIFGKGPKSMIVGGTCEAKLSVETARLGSVANTPTIIKVGIDPKMAERIKQTDDEIASIKESHEKVGKSIGYLKKLKSESKGKLPSDKAQLLEKLESIKTTLPGKIEVLEKFKRKLFEEQKEMQNSYVIASNAVFPKVQVYIGTQFISIKDNLGPSQFKFASGEVIRLSK